MIHPHTKVELISPQKGYGVVATQPLPKGTITWVQDSLDRVFTPKQYNAFSDIYKKILDTYTFRNGRGNYILCWDNEKYVNHSFRPNCLSTAYEFEIAIKDIDVGEELTDDYGYLNISEPFRGLEEGTKRKIVYPDDLRKYYKSWDKKLLSAIKHINSVSQELYIMLPQKTKNTISQVLRGNQKMESILSIYYNQST